MVDQIGWERICLSFYKDNDEVAQKAVEIFEKRGNDCVNHEPWEVLLRSVGLDHPSDLSEADYMECIRTKNSARKKVHAQRDLERRKHLNTLLVKYGEDQIIDSKNFQRSNESFQNFVSRYAKNFVIQPFFRGLAKLLEIQLKSRNKWRWILKVEDFTERDYPQFMDDAIPHLCQFCVWISSDVDSSVPIGCHGWDVKQSISDDQLKKVLYLLKRSNSKTNGVVGQFHETEFPRTNQDGQLDEITDSACPNCSIT